MQFGKSNALICGVFALGLSAANASSIAIEQKLEALAGDDPMIGRQVSQMLSRIESGQAEQVIQSTMQDFFRIAPDGRLTQTVLDLAQQRETARVRAALLGQYLAYDLDGDGAVDASEMDGFFGDAAARLATLRGVADGDGDGVISAQELRNEANAQAERQSGQRTIRHLLAFDLDEDGVVLVDEILQGFRLLRGEDHAVVLDNGPRIIADGPLAPAADEAAPVERAQTNPDGLPVELHMVGIYEPRTSRTSDGRAMREDVVVKVDRPGVSVVLVLGSYEATRWTIETTEGTRVDRIVAHDRNRARGEVLLNGEDAAVTYRDLPIAYRQEGNRFQPFHKAAQQVAGQPNASSFVGAYRAPEDGFVIDEAPGVPTVAEIEAALEAGALPATELSKTLRRAFESRVAAPGAAWQLRDEGFVGVDADGKSVVYPLDLDAPEVSWPMGAAFDPEGGRIWGVTLGGVGYLYEYDIAGDRWTARSMDNVDAGGLIFDPLTGNLIATPGPHGRSGYLIMDTNAEVLAQLEFDPADYPGLIGTYDPGNGPTPRMVPVMIEGAQLLVRADADRRLEQNTRSRWFYLVDLQSGDVRLVR